MYNNLFEILDYDESIHYEDPLYNKIDFLRIKLNKRHRDIFGKIRRLHEVTGVVTRKGEEDDETVNTYTDHFVIAVYYHGDVIKKTTIAYIDQDDYMLDLYIIEDASIVDYISRYVNGQAA